MASSNQVNESEIKSRNFNLDINSKKYKTPFGRISLSRSNYNRLLNILPQSISAESFLMSVLDYMKDNNISVEDIVTVRKVD